MTYWLCLPTETVDLVRRLAAKGLTDRQIAERMDCTLARIKGIRGRYHIRSRYQPKLRLVRYTVKKREIDDVLVERIMTGDRRVPQYVAASKRSTPGGRRLNPNVIEAVRRLAARGLDDVAICVRLNGRFKHSAVGRMRRRHGIPSGKRLAGAA